MLQDKNRMQNYQVLFKSTFRQLHAVFYKNMRNHLGNKKKLLAQLVLPIVISIVFIFSKKLQKQNQIVALLLGVLLKIYIGLIGTSAIRELITIFITERIDNFRQYQMIFGLTHRLHTLSNLFYMKAYMSFFLIPFYITLNIYEFKLVYILNFGAFVISSCTLAMALTAFFKDHKIAIQVIGIVFSLSAFLPFTFDSNRQHYNPIDYLTLCMPNSAFTVAILQNNLHASLLSLFMVKFYLIIYSVAQFPQYYKDLFFSFCRTINEFSPLRNRQPNNLMEEFELNQNVNSDLQANASTIRDQNIAIKAESITKTYKVNNIDTNALNSINLRIKKSEIFGLLGRNGAGKTTLVDILTKVTPPTSGVFQIKSKKQTVGICYQHQILYENMTVSEHLKFYSLIKDMSFREGQSRESHIQEIIRTLNIQSQKNKKSKQLSGGNKRKLSVAIAILGKPDILIFDEPTSGLDPLSRIYVWEIFQNLRNIYECTIILTTHHLDEAERLADWICVIEKGSIIVENTAQKIKQKYGKGYHLSLTHSQDINGRNRASQIERYKQIIQKAKLKYLELEHVDQDINFLIKPFSKDITPEQFQDNFIVLVEMLQELSGITISFHSNTLQQSFIAIIKDTQNSGDSIGEQQLVSVRGNFQEEQRSCFIVGFYQIIGIFLKNLYFHRSILIRSLTIYNINIIIILLSKFFNVILKSYLSSAIEGEDIDTAQTQNGTILLQGYIIMAAAFITNPVYEREKRIRQVLNTRGLNPLCYWLGNFLFDYIIFSANLLIVAFAIVPELMSSYNLSQIFTLGIGIIVYTYTCSFLFNKVRTANAWFSLINIVMGFIIMPLIIFGNNTLFGHLDFLKYFYPYYDFIVEVFFQSQNKAVADLANITKPTSKTLIPTIFIYVFAIIILETKLIARIRKCLFNKQAIQNVNQAIKLDDVSKNYGNLHALQNVSYFVREQRLALLGHNGAGKSTTFSLLSAQAHQSSGKIFLEGKLKDSFTKRLQSAGICFQDDALWQQLTVYQILKVTSYLIPIHNSDRENKWLFESLEFDPNNQYKRFNALSGGNKRKLCMMVALYGDPNIRLLDECSTGLDPSSRVAMVDTIKYSRRGSTVFTTHSMSEAQNICTKAVIMSKGKLLEFDYISKMKKKHFNCCWVELKINKREKEEDQARISLQKQLLEEGFKIFTSEKDKISIQIIKIDTKMSKVMRRFQKLKQSKIIYNYTNIEPKLEDVYIKVTRADEEVSQVPLNQIPQN